ncbi:SRPBCC family protein [Tundrisphaera lichenicola]|uniref:SRPBCC family protein n=1 Tax=Tundrisphaera lichenicola TaxID=2029860 RepID=UPI003EBFA3CA
MTPLDPKTDLVLERIVDVLPELVWKAWTTPEHLKKWFTPKPWKTVHCEIDLKPGGKFHTVMESPEGQQFPNTGCYLEVVPGRKLIWTGALLPGYRPAKLSADVPFVFTAIIEIEPHGSGTKYTATVFHTTEEERSKHEAMGFHNGWGAALDQLVALAKSW